MKKEITARDLRIFGLIWGFIFAFFTYKSEDFMIFFGLVSLGFIFSAIISPRIYLDLKLYQGWVKFGEILGKINSFIIIAILFYGVFTPAGIMLRLLKKDLLNKKLDRLKTSYFIDRKTQPGSMKQQF
jgi:Saxitoxin biosynthesis operon protein SxtJ